MQKVDFVQKLMLRHYKPVALPKLYILSDPKNLVPKKTVDESSYTITTV